MSRNPQAVLDVLEFYSENMVSKVDPVPQLSRAGTSPMPLNRIDNDLKPSDFSTVRTSQSIMDMQVYIG
jgi:hypothetical protein